MTFCPNCKKEVKGYMKQNIEKCKIEIFCSECHRMIDYDAGD